MGAREANDFSRLYKRQKEYTMKKLTIFGLIAALAILLGGWACSPATDAAYIQTAKTLTDAWLGVYDPGAIVKVDPLFTAAIVSLQTYSPGQPCATIVTALNAVGAALSAESNINATGRLAILTILSGVDLITAHYASCQPVVAAVSRANDLPPAPATAKELKAAYLTAGGPKPK